MAEVCLEHDATSSKPLSPCASTIYDRLSGLCALSRNNPDGDGAPEPTVAQRRLLAEAGRSGLLVGTCYATAKILGRGPKNKPNARKYRIRNVQVALADLSAAGLAVRYASGPHRSIAWAVFSEPCLQLAAGLWEEAAPDFKKRLCAAGVGQLPGFEQYAGSELAVLAHEADSLDPAVWADQGGDLADGETYNETWRRAPLTTLARLVLERLRRFCNSRRRAAPPLSVPQVTALGEESAAQLYGKCWASLRALACAVRTAEKDYSERAVQTALRDLEIHGWILPYSVGPLASTSFMVFDEQQSLATLLRVWQAAPESFIKRMGRSRYLDRPKDDQEIGERSYDLRAKEKQHTGDAVVSLSEISQNTDNALPSTLTEADQAPAAPVSEQPSATEFPATSSNGRELLARLRAWGMSDAGLTLADEVIAVADALRCELLPVERYLETSGKSFDIALAYCLRHLKAIQRKPIRPRSVAAYLTASLTHDYKLPPEPPAPKPNSAPQPVRPPLHAACPNPAPREEPPPPPWVCPRFDELLAAELGSPEHWPYRSQVMVRAEGDRIVVEPLLEGDFMRQMCVSSLAGVRSRAEQFGNQLVIAA